MAFYFSLQVNQNHMEKRRTVAGIDFEKLAESEAGELHKKKSFISPFNNVNCVMKHRLRYNKCLFIQNFLISYQQDLDLNICTVVRRKLYLDLNICAV